MDLIKIIDGLSAVDEKHKKRLRNAVAFTDHMTREVKKHETSIAESGESHLVAALRETPEDVFMNFEEAMHEYGDALSAEYERPGKDALVSILEIWYTVCRQFDEANNPELIDHQNAVMVDKRAWKFMQLGNPMWSRLLTKKNKKVARKRN